MSLLARVTGSVLFLTNNCYCKLTTNCAKVKLHRNQFSKNFKKSEQCCSARFVCSESDKPPQKIDTYVPYDQLLAQRREEAQRSIIVQILSFDSCADIYSYCSNFGIINQMFHYTTESNGDKQNFVLIEFEQKQHVDAIVSSSTHVNHDQIIPTHTSMLWFRNDPKQMGRVRNITSNQMKLSRNSNRILDDIDINKRLVSAKSLSDQIVILYNSTKLNEVGIRLRFYTANQIEHCFRSLFPNIAAYPFGSSVNGYGKQGCDLDLSLVLNTDYVEKTESRLIFHTKSISFNERHQMTKIMELLAETINTFLPGVFNVRKILGARVPIIKFDNVFCALECDLAMTNMTAYYMSELLYMYGEMDWRVRPLTFAIRKWATNLSLVIKRSPGPWITNFSITLMVLFFLQQKKILPSVTLLKSRATKDDVRLADSYVDCTFQRDIDKMPKSSNNEPLNVLLKDFFVYYSQFDFSTKSLSLKVGKPVVKPQFASLHICNPLENGLNVSKNVSNEQLDRLIMAMRNAAHQVNVTATNNPKSWGLLSLLANDGLSELSRKKKQSDKFDFQSLFEKESEVVRTS